MKNISKEIILEILHKNKNKIRSFGVIRLVLFGSYARDEQTDVSDIDFLVEFEKNRGLFRDFFNLKHCLEDLFDRNVDLVEPEYVREELKSYILEGLKYEAGV